MGMTEIIVAIVCLVIGAAVAVLVLRSGKAGNLREAEERSRQRILRLSRSSAMHVVRLRR